MFNNNRFSRTQQQQQPQQQDQSSSLMVTTSYRILYHDMKAGGVELGSRGDIFNITAKAVREDEEPVALQAIEFWSSIGDEEINILEEYGGDFTGDSDIPCFYFIMQAPPALASMLLETLLKQEEAQDQDEGAWNIAMAGGTCLGPSLEKLTPLVNIALNFKLTALTKDPNNHALLTVTHREDAGESRLRTAAHEMLNEVVRCSTDETAPMELQLVPVIMTELHNTLEGQKLPSDEREKQGELQGLLCGCLQVIIQKLGSSEPTKYVFIQYADHIVGLFLRVCACRSATVHEEAMLAIGALTSATGPDFAKYMPEFYKYLEMGLQNFEYQVCAVIVGVVGDICRALEDKILPYCDGIMTQLLKDLSSNQLHRSVKPMTLALNFMNAKTTTRSQLYQSSQMMASCNNREVLSAVGGPNTGDGDMFWWGSFYDGERGALLRRQR
ncbi:hypothetical protein D5086_005821 [Populus alba]|uniref:Uncharacterized protein n=1 Tax=Populus alba TaxID=43335 RepID=A0ACC4CV34_POPAL